MSKYSKKLVYFNKNNEDLFDKIKDKEDFSTYVCDLIRADIEGEKASATNEDLNEIKAKLDEINQKLNSGIVVKSNELDNQDSDKKSETIEDYSDMNTMM